MQRFFAVEILFFLLGLFFIVGVIICIIVLMIPKKHYFFSLLKIQFLILLILVPFKVSAQELPLVNNFSQKKYNAEAQNWSISQSKDGGLFVANNLGLLEFNGAKWKLYPTPNSTIMRSVNVFEDKIFTGFYMDFGYWLRDKFGELYFTSIVSKYQIPVIEDEQFWNIIQYDDWVLFQSLQRIYFYNLKTNEYKVISSDVKITKMFSVKNTIYFQQLGKGLFKIDNGESKLISDDILFQEKDIINIHEGENQLIILTSTEGFVKLENNQLNPWKRANKNLQNKKVYNSIQLKNKGFAIGTISDGLLFLTDQGDLSYQIDQRNGLSNNTVLSLSEDAKGIVWLGLDNGISSVNVNSQIKTFNDKDGRIGSVYATIFYKDDLYLGTNQGLFVKKYTSDNGFKIIEGTQGQVWSLAVFDDKLFCGHDSGTLIIENRKIITKINIQGTWDFKKIDDRTLIQGNYSGLYILEKKKTGWRLRNKIKGFMNSSKSFELFNKNQIIVNHEYKGVYVLKVDDDFREVTAQKNDLIIGKEFHSSIVKYKERILYAYKHGVYEFSKKTNTFTKDTVLSKLYTAETYSTGKMVFDKRNDLLWSFSKKDISYVKPNAVNQKLTIKKIPISKTLRAGAEGYENLTALGNEDIILGINNGYIVLNLNDIDTDQSLPPVSINSIKNNVLNQVKEKVVLDRKGDFFNAKNNIEFEYSVPYLKQDLEIEYQYLLEGYTDKWSNWSTNSSMSFENLPYGKAYTFSVRAKIGNVNTLNSASYSFDIKNPWYFTLVAKIGYAILILLLLLIIDRVYKKYYRAQRKRLLEKQEKDFKLKSLAKEKELIQSKNDQLKIDFDSKSRELASSTMSIIKKNELLNSIKSELNKDEEKGIKNVIKIIDKNINNTDDWQMFKEAFNNADKDFIKKLKSLHSVLTPNDLRLCAYLRLNLSSKEIAPLLNISPRSVEVKRYRLRKKMNLEHNANLINYILEI